MLLSLKNKNGTENVPPDVLASSLTVQVLPDSAMQAVAVALSGAVSELAQAKSHLSLAAVRNMKDLL